MRGLATLFVAVAIGSAAVPALSGSAIRLDGVDDHVNIPHHTSLSLQTFTVEAWIRFDNDSDLFRRPAISKGTNQGNYTLGIAGHPISGSSSTVNYPGYSHRIFFGNVSIGSSTDLVAGEWNHLAVTYSAGTLRLHLNGQLENTYSDNPEVLAPIENFENVFLGRSVFSSAADQFLQGALDEVRVWDVARTQAQILGTMNCEITPDNDHPDLSDLVGNWSFNEAPGDQEVRDSSPVGNHGTLGANAQASADDPTRIPRSLAECPGNPITAAGRVPDGTGGSQPLEMTVAPEGGLRLSWGPSCLFDTDFGVYEGTLGDFESHFPKLCATGGATSTVLPMPGGSTYYLVVPNNEFREGSYGLRSDLGERAPGRFACLSQNIGTCPSD